MSKIRMLGTRYVAGTGNSLNQYKKGQVLWLGKDIAGSTARYLIAMGYAEEVR